MSENKSENPARAIAYQLLDQVRAIDPAIQCVVLMVHPSDRDTCIMAAQSISKREAVTLLCDQASMLVEGLFEEAKNPCEGDVKGRVSS